MTSARPPAEPARAALERAFGAELFAGAATGPSAVNLTGIPSPVKAKMEAAFGTDFSGVRVHPSSSRAVALGALAYTQGSEIHVAPGQWAPETTRGQELLGHELAHVVHGARAGDGAVQGDQAQRRAGAGGGGGRDGGAGGPYERRLASSDGEGARDAFGAAARIERCGSTDAR
ncbi:hypothetical protein BE20_31530 [Sorangium cellulosum]|nr:hypothetical protein BE20_31530 [Sorangium cellulosum]